MNCTRGSISLQDVPTGFGYVSQNTWLQRGTIRSNIVWGQVFDESFYNTVIHACGLSDDLDKLGGDQTFVGDKGMTLSGGQRMRVALARAIYQKKQIYLFDDILSSLDVHVANHVIKYCLLGLLANTTRVVVSDQRVLQRRASQILHFDNGQMVVHDPVNLYPSYVSDEDDDEQLGGGSSTHSAIGESGCENTAPKEREREEVMGDMANEEEHFEEIVESGSLKNKTISAYWSAVTAKLGISVLLSVFFMQATRNYSDILLAQWVAASTDDNSTQKPIDEKSGSDLLGFYSGVVIANSILILARSFLFAYAGIKAAIYIHDKLLSRVINVSNVAQDETSLLGH